MGNSYITGDHGLSTGFTYLVYDPDTEEYYPCGDTEYDLHDACLGLIEAGLFETMEEFQDAAPWLILKVKPTKLSKFMSKKELKEHFGNKKQWEAEAEATMYHRLYAKFNGENPDKVLSNIEEKAEYND